MLRQRAHGELGPHDTTLLEYLDDMAEGWVSRLWVYLWGT
jgi:hypothetical protein